MNLRAIVSHDESSSEKYQEEYQKLKEKLIELGLEKAGKYIQFNKGFKEGTRKRQSGYAHYTFSGELIEELKDIWVQERVFRPSMEDSKRDALYNGWQEAVDRCLS